MTSRCQGCFKTITGGAIELTTKSGQKHKYHDSCLKCTKCEKHLTKVFADPDTDFPYCEGCYGSSVVRKRCQKCFKYLNVNEECVTYEGKEYHPECFKCDKCNKTISGTKFYIDKELIICTACHNK